MASTRLKLGGLEFLTSVGVLLRLPDEVRLSAPVKGVEVDRRPVLRFSLFPRLPGFV